MGTGQLFLAPVADPRVGGLRPPRICPGSAINACAPAPSVATVPGSIASRCPFHPTSVGWRWWSRPWAACVVDGAGRTSALGREPRYHPSASALRGLRSPRRDSATSCARDGHRAGDHRRLRHGTDVLRPIRRQQDVRSRARLRIDLFQQGVSRRHCTVENSGLTVTVTDLESVNGTFVNGKPVRRGRLQAGDEPAVGPVVLTCRAQLLQLPGPGALEEQARLVLREEESSSLVRKVVDTSHPSRSRRRSLPRRSSAHSATWRPRTESLD